MKAVGIIPARFASSRFPGKALAPIAGIPMLERVWTNARAAQSLESVIVATDDERIAQPLRDRGASVIVTRGVYASGTDRVASVARELECELVVNIQGDEPLLDSASIDAAVQLLAAAPMVTVVTPIRSLKEFEDVHTVKVVVGRGDVALYFSRAPVPSVRPERTINMLMDLKGCYRHVGVYAFQREMLLQVASLPASPLEEREGLEQLRFLEQGIPIRVVKRPGPFQSVDTPADIARVERFLAGS